MEPPKKKVIQKRVARRERFARMARLRYRKTGDIPIAKVQDLDLPPKYVPQNAVYEHSLGLLVTEVDGELYNDVSLLNTTYNSKSITVVNEKSKLLCIKLHKNDHKEVPLNEGVLQEWEKRNDDYWAAWAKHFKTMTENHKKFVESNKDKFESNKLDEEAQQRYKAYCTQRDNILAKGACMEMRIRFDSKNSSCNELNINSDFVNSLNYDFEEFVQKVLMEGIPQFRSQKSYGVKRRPAILKNFETVFSSTFEVRIPDMYFLGKNNNVKKVDYSLLVSGYFVKNAAEMSVITRINSASNLHQNEELPRPIYRLYLEQQMVHENERKFFLESFYPEQLRKLVARQNNKTCAIKECSDTIETEEETIENEVSSDGGKMSEELVVRDSNINLDSPSNNVSVPFTDLLTKFMPHFQMMKSLYENKQQLLGMMMQQQSGFKGSVKREF